jgi:tellurite resistance protein
MRTIGDSRDSGAAAHVVALFVAANGRMDPRELRVLDELKAYGRLGVSREGFLALVAECLERVGDGLSSCSWLHARDQAYVEELLDAVVDPAERLTACRLAAAILTADGRITGDERLVFGHALARWHITRAMVSQAILDDGNRPWSGAHPAVP